MQVHLLHCVLGLRAQLGTQPLCLLQAGGVPGSPALPRRVCLKAFAGHGLDTADQSRPPARSCCTLLCSVC